MPNKETDWSLNHKISQEPEKVPTTTHIFVKPNNPNNPMDFAASIFETTGVMPKEQALYQVLSDIKEGKLAFDNTTTISVIYPQDEQRTIQILTSLLIHPILRPGNTHDRCNFPTINIIFDSAPSQQTIKDLEVTFDSTITTTDLEFNPSNSNSRIDQETRNRIFGSINFQTI